ncbi:MAG TPA: CoA pyrophosphatase [Anaerovoracaceae bacterium]|nr:CoA pyrophosphatase [Anaerovoracaceae bacterium]
MKNLGIHDFKKAFKNYKPGPLGYYRYYSVLVPLVEQDGGLHILYEVRADTLRTQPGQVSFPGGRIEEGETPEECAVREACEELCLKSSDIRIISPMDYLHTYSNFTMYPFLGVIDYNACTSVTASSDEVKEIFFVPLEYLMEVEPLVYNSDVYPKIPSNFPYEKINESNEYNWRKGTTSIPIYQYKDYAIWGMTALITQNLIEMMKNYQKAQPVKGKNE